MTAVFETMRVKQDRIPLLERHLLRFSRNARVATGIDLPKTVAEKIAAASALRRDDHVLRIEWDGKDLTITTRDLPSLDAVSLIVSAVSHPGYSVKTTERAAFDRARSEAREAGADEAILLTRDGFVAEGSLFALGWFEGDTIRLPSLDLDILPSIGRERVITGAAKLGIAIEEGHFRWDDLLGKPAFVTTSVRGVVAIDSLDGRAVAADDRIAALAAVFWP